MPNQPAFRQALARVLSTQKGNGKQEGVRAMELIQPYMDDDADIALSATAAMACAQAGRFDLAVNWQKRGLKLAQNQGAPTDFLQANLNRYQSNKAAEKPWSDQDPIFKVRTYGR